MCYIKNGSRFKISHITHIEMQVEAFQYIYTIMKSNTKSLAISSCIFFRRDHNKLNIL